MATDVKFLTQREQEILVHACDGFSTKQSARKLNISVATVRFHYRSIYLKLGVRGRTAAILFALQNRMVQPGWITEKWVSETSARLRPAADHSTTLNAPAL